MLASYVNGTLPDDERREVERQLSANPEYQQELAFQETLQRLIRNGVPPTPPDFGLEKALARIRTNPVPAKPPKPISEPGWLARFLGIGYPPRLVYALGLLVIVVQTGVIGRLALEDGGGYSETRARSTVAPAAGPFIKVSFKPEATEAEMRFLLVGIGGSIVGGPSQLGDYFLFLDSKRTDWAAQQLRQSAIVDAATVIATLPAMKE